MKSACCSHQHLNLCLRCVPHSQRPVPVQSQYDSTQDMNTKYAELMETQLAKLSADKQQQIDDLTHSISKLKMTISKLEVRSAMDKKGQQEMRDKMDAQADRIRDLQNQLMNAQMQPKEVVTKEMIKEVVIRVPVGDGKEKLELDRLSVENAQLRASLAQKQTIFQEREARLLRQLGHANKSVEDLQESMAQLEALLGRKSSDHQRLQTENKYLQQRIEIISKSYSQPIQPVVLTRIDHPLPQVQTVYVDRPVLKTEFVEIEKVVNRFLQPERPIINRIIQCQKQQNGDKYEGARESSNCQHECEQLSLKYEGVLSSYKNERQNLVKLIQERDHDYHLLSRKAQLNQKYGNSGIGGKNSQCVDVEVTVIKNQPAETDRVRNTTSKKTVQTKARRGRV